VRAGMKLNLAYPATGCQKLMEIDDENKLRAFYDKRMSSEVDGVNLGDEFKGYVFKVSGGNDNEGFPMKQGVLTSSRVRLLLSKGHSCFRERREGERKRKSVRGCIVSSDLAVLNLVVVKKGEKDIPGLTDQIKPRLHGPKRASKIRKLFNLTKEDDVRDYNIKRKVKRGEKSILKQPKIQRLITPQRLQRKRHLRNVKKNRWGKSREEAKEFNEMMLQRYKEHKDKRGQQIAKRRSVSLKLSTDKKEGKSEKSDTKPDKSKTDKPKTDKPKTDKPKTVKPKSDKPKGDKPKGDKPKSDKPKSDKPKTKTDKPKTDKAKTEKPKAKPQGGK